MSYDVVGLLGRGGSAVVELAVDSDGRHVATKRLALTGSATQIHVARQRLRREAEILSRLAHPGIVPVIDLVEEGSEVVLVLPALSESLEDRVARLGPRPPAEVARIGRLLIDALAAAHRAGVVHRDIKPANVLFDHKGVPALADFGVAMTRDATAGLTITGSVVGTPMWMAPEQARGETAGPPSDVFALAATLVFAATAQGPYNPGPPEAVIQRAARAEVRPVPPAVPDVLRRPLEHMLDPRPGRRPSASAVLGGLGGTLVAPPPERSTAPGGLTVADTAVAAPAPVAPTARTAGLVRRAVLGPARPGTRLTTRRRVALLAAVVAAVAAVAGVVALGLSGSPSAPARAHRVAAPHRAPCVPLPYQACGASAPAPHANGQGCDQGWYDLDGIAANGCEAHHDYVPGTVLTSDQPVHANLIPIGSTDSFTTHVSGHASNLCWGSLHVTLTAPPGTAERLTVLNGSKVQGTADSVNGTPATVTMSKPSCFGADSKDLTVQVTSDVPTTSARDFTLTRDGGW